MADAQKAYHDKHVLVIYGILVGAELDAMSDGVSRSCALAEKARGEEDMKDVIVWE